MLLLGLATAGLAPGPATGLSGRPSQAVDRFAGFGPEAAREEALYESRLLRAIDRNEIRRWARALGSRPHVAGTPEQEATRDSVLAWMEEAGLVAYSDTLVVYLPHPLRVSLERTHPDPRPISLDEPELAEAGPPGRDPFRAFNAFTGSGRAEGAVVFANYGLAGDYRSLDSLGVAVTGAVVVARYGRSFRGIKAREAERHGAAALVLYSDPADDGYRAGDVYPGGPMRPGFGVQRGSLLNAFGDPSTPGWPSVPGAPRVPEEEMSGIARIPVVPISYEAAAELLADLDGPSAPPGWMGALPFPYRLGPGPVRARLAIETERGAQAFHSIHNTIATLPGREFPDEWIIVGAHRDAWGPGALDNVSGTANVIAVARAFAEAATDGWRPRRSVIFATWDAEEWGLMGSTEWVEAHVEQVADATVAYLNQDSPVGGPQFRAAATPELKSLVRAAAAAVASPGGAGTVYDRWATETTGEPTRTPPVGDLGGGSDHVPFVQSLGIPGAGFGFGGGSGGVYHSAYDAADWMERFGDPGYRRHAASASVLAVIAARLANAELLPYDFPALAADLEKRIGEVAVEARRTVSAEDSLTVLAALQRLQEEAFRLAAEAGRFDSAAAAALLENRSPAVWGEANRHARAAARAFVSGQGLPGLSGVRQLLYATDPDDGYATLPLPSLRLSLRETGASGLHARLGELSERVAAATLHLAAARRALDVNRS